jgi:hypothetical protein
VVVFESSKLLLLVAGMTGIFAALAHRAMDKMTERPAAAYGWRSPSR